MYDAKPDGHVGEPIDLFARNPGARILVADDDDEMRKLLVEVLLNDGYEVYDAKSGDELLLIVQSIKVNSWTDEIFDLLVIDVSMPGLSGLEALRRLRMLHCETPAVLVTGFPDEGTRLSAARLRAPLLAKPFPLQALSDAVLTSLLSRQTEARPFRAP